MTVPSTIADLSTVAADNSPQGSEPIGTSLDNYIRSGFSFIKQLSNEKANLSGSLFFGAFGYGLGAGGTVTQATNKGTAVTLSKPCGQIELSNSALGAGVIAQFVFNNSLIGPKDKIDVWVNRGTSTLQNYRVWASTFNDTGKCYVEVKNETAGSLSDAVVLGFQISKGAVG